MAMGRAHHGGHLNVFISLEALVSEKLSFMHRLNIVDVDNDNNAMMIPESDPYITPAC